MRDGCPFCDYEGPSEILGMFAGKGDVFVIEPIRPVVAGHVLVVPRLHVPDFVDVVTAEEQEAVEQTFTVAGIWAATHAGYEACNVITSRGEAATQTVTHLHVHLVPRREGDGLLLPWDSPRWADL